MLSVVNISSVVRTLVQKKEYQAAYLLLEKTSVLFGIEMPPKSECDFNSSISNKFEEILAQIETRFFDKDFLEYEGYYRMLFVCGRYNVLIESLLYFVRRYEINWDVYKNYVHISELREKASQFEKLRKTGWYSDKVSSIEEPYLMAWFYRDEATNTLRNISEVELESLYSEVKEYFSK